ncbi:hypothetical protein [uncultured Desulfovibrio sp.]|uniref:hypothetical protein n=1 Tax=uncultured Desulfovibrio sp. TaxID=167968 RepID=UPI00261A7EC8|nr:hypothetical protein [uncultured Desulfovibrio sp.]
MNKILPSQQPPQRLRRHVLVGNGEFIGYWVSVEDFLARYLLRRLFPTEQELRIFLQNNPAHPICTFMSSFHTFQSSDDKSLVCNEEQGQIVFHIRCALHLLLVDNSGLLLERNIKRIKNTGNFWGAMYEIFVLSYFITGKFTIQAEDETDVSRRHCEFIATHKNGCAFDVEAKSKNRDFSLITKKDLEDNKTNMIRILKEALKKPARNRRLIFANVNIPSLVSYPQRFTWADGVSREIKKIYDARKDGKKWPNASFVLTNFPELTAKFTPSIKGPELCIAAVNNRSSKPDLSTPDFVPLNDLSEAFKSLRAIPTSFDQLSQWGIRSWLSST